MAQVTQQPLLSICIPIYNRLSYLERQLNRMLEDKDLFDNTIELLISDNCSEEDLETCCKAFQNKGLQLRYNRNNCNIGADGNFEFCFRHTRGKYTWLLGSDDIPASGLVREVVEILNKNDLGLLHLNYSPSGSNLRLFSNSETMLVEVSHWVTFMSVNIIKTSSIVNLDFRKYYNTYLIQVPAYILACISECQNGILSYGHELFEINHDVLSGYNFYEVFVKNFLGIYEDFLESNHLTKKGYKKIKKVLFKRYVAPLTVRYMIFKEKTMLKLDNGWHTIFSNYGVKPYVVFYLSIWFIWFLFKRPWRYSE